MNEPCKINHLDVPTGDACPRCGKIVLRNELGREINPPESTPSPDLRFCGICWRGELADPNKDVMHSCGEKLGHKEPHACHCGATLSRPVRLAPLRKDS